MNIRKGLLIWSLCFLTALFSSPVSAQVSPQEFMKELQNLPAQTAAAISEAIGRGDFETAQKIYLAHKMKNIPGSSAQSPGPGGPAVRQPEKTSLFERTLSGDFPRDLVSAGLHQFGYDIFMKTSATFIPASSVPVGPDYIVGPGDQFTLTLWGTTEGIYTFTVSKEGNITLPKVGVVAVAGVRFGALETTLRRHLAKFYTNFNLSVAMGSLKAITVYVVGEVQDPGSYALNSLTTAYGALFTAGGPTKKGSMRMVQILRAGKVVKTIDLYDFLLRGDRSQDVRLQHEDTVFVPLIGPVAGVAGTVYRPAIYELKGSESIGDLIRTAGGIMPIALSSRLQLSRFINNEKKVILDIQVSNPPDESSAKSQPVPELRGKVSNMDVISIFPIYDKVWETVILGGDVQHPGEYQWRPDLKLREIILQGQLLPTADLEKAEIIRLSDDFKDRKIIPVRLAPLMKGDESQNILLRPKDEVRIYTSFRAAEQVSVSGEVMSAGTYTIQNGERLSELMRRVGGFTQEAYPYGAVFKRRDVKNAEAKNVQSFVSRLQSQILQTSAGSTATAATTEEASLIKSEMIINQSILENLKRMQEQFEGRVAITITGNIDEWAGTKDDLLLQDGDSLHIPKRPQEVLVMGEVHSPGALVFIPGLTVKDYIDHTGGLTKYADDGQVFVVQANGFAFSENSPSVGSIESIELKAGDSVFVPQKLERQAAMRLTRDIVDILFKTAVVIGLIVAAF